MSNRSNTIGVLQQNLEFAWRKIGEILNSSNLSDIEFEILKSKFLTLLNDFVQGTAIMVAEAETQEKTQGKLFDV